MRSLFVALCAIAVLWSDASSSAETQPGNGAAAFKSLQSLAGEWQAPLPKGEVMTNIFRPIAFGTALMHEEWKNGEQITATVFYVVGSELRADHFCDMGNQLRYVVARSPDTGAMHFTLREAFNLDTHPMHFRSTTWQFIDAQHHVQDWESVRPGREPKVVRMQFTRVK
jgi:hypothetical protein